MRRSKYRVRHPAFHPRSYVKKLGLTPAERLSPFREDKDWKIFVEAQRTKCNSNSKSSYYCSGRCSLCDGRSKGKSWGKEKHGHKDKLDRTKKQVIKFMRMQNKDSFLY